eukprot:44934_1
MGNKISSPELYLSTYSHLLNMDFKEDLALCAAQKYGNDTNAALDWIVKQQKLIDKLPADDVCQRNDISNCIALKRIIPILKYYHHNYNKFISLHKYLDASKTHLLSDYHHILDKHLNDDKCSQANCNAQFAKIYELILKKSGLSCDINKCKIFVRNNRDIENSKQRITDCDDQNLAVYIDILDNIHCYFFHSVDIGCRIINSNHTNQIHDTDMIHIKSLLASKRDFMEKVRGRHRKLYNRFTTKLTQNKNMNAELKIPEHDINDDIQYDFGQRYNYWSHWNGNNVSKKVYSSIKEEVLFNNMVTISHEIWSDAMQKATEQQTRSEWVKRKICKHVPDEYRRSTKEGQKMGINHILSIILYTDFDELSRKFSETFRKINNETSKSARKRNEQFWNWSKTLCETVNSFWQHEIFENNLPGPERLFHGITLMYFDQIIAQFNGPLSTTTQLQTALGFSPEGIVLEFNTLRRDDRYFNCTFLSRFGAIEAERLFIRPYSFGQRLELGSIRNVSTNENYRMYIESISYFERIINKHNHCGWHQSLFSCTASIINDFISFSLTPTRKCKMQYPEYIVKTLEKWMCRHERINIDCSQVIRFAKRVNIRHHEIDNLIRLDKVSGMFRNVKSIVCHETGVIDLHYWSALLSIMASMNDMYRNDNLKEIHFEDVKNIENFTKSNTLVEAFSAFNWSLILNATGFLLRVCDNV